MSYRSTADLFPLPVSHASRTKPEHFIPDVDDETGYAELVWNIMLNLKLGLGKASGVPFREMAQEWQRKLIWAIYGPANADGDMLVSEVFVSMAKKNGKTSLLALIAIAHALAFEKSDARFVLLASTKDQANLLYTPIKSAIEQDSELMKICNVRDYKGDVVFTRTQTNIRCISPELHSTVGEAPEFYVVDEVHLLGRKRTGASMVRQLSSGLSVTGGIGYYITTSPIAGEPAAGIYLGIYNRAQRILAGEAESENLLPILFELPEDADPHERSLWWMPNPSMGTTVKMPWLKQQYDIAASDPDPVVLAEFFSQHLNLRVDDIVAGLDSWIISSRWSTWADRSITLSRIRTECSAVYAGIDVGGQADMTGLVVIGLRDGQWLLWSRAWLTKEGYQAHPKNQPLYDDFIERDELEIVDTAGDDIEELEGILESLPLTGIGVDPYGLEEAALRMEKVAPILAVPRGYKMSPHIEAFERLCFRDELLHNGSTCMAWCVANTVIETKTEAKTMRKPGDKYSDKKIDLSICAVNAWAVANNADVGPSVYESETFVV